MSTPLRQRAIRLIKLAFGDQMPGPAIVKLANFASQNSGIESANYYNRHDLQAGRRETYRQGVKAYNEELRSISKDWARFKAAMIEAAAEGVTEARVIQSASAFSGRLTWEDEDWRYCTGQYFPTEYRKAAASVLEAAIRQTRLDRPATERQVRTIAQLKALNEENGGCWFGKGEMAFFGTRIESGIIAGKYFISSEQPPHGPRKYSVREFDAKGSVDTVGEFCTHSTLQEAMAAVPKAAAVAA